MTRTLGGVKGSIYPSCCTSAKSLFSMSPKHRLKTRVDRLEPWGDALALDIAPGRGVVKVRSSSYVGLRSHLQTPMCKYGHRHT